jgi:hypothetical protein
MAAPSTATCGDTLSWLTSLADYPATAGWVLTYTLVPRSGAPRSITCSAEGSDHRATVSAATSAGWAPGAYTLVGTVSKAGERYTVEQGSITLQADLAAASTGVDTRSPARQALDDMDAALRVYGSKAYLQSVAYGDRSQSFRSPSDFMAFRSRLQAEVAREAAAQRTAAGGANPNRLYVRFGRTR